MDLFEEYQSFVMEDFIEAEMEGRSIWIKSSEEGQLVIYSPDRRLKCRCDFFTISVPKVKRTLNLAGVLEECGQDMYIIDIAKFKEGDTNGRLIE